MGCKKCEKLDKLYDELRCLCYIEDYLTTLSTLHGCASESLDNIAHAIPITLNAPDEKKLCNDVIQLNKDTAKGLDSMNKHLQTAMDKLQKLIKKTQKEDDAYHKTHKTKSMVSRSMVARMSTGNIYIDMRDHVM